MDVFTGFLIASLGAIFIGFLYKKTKSQAKVLPVRVSGHVDPRFKNVEEVFRKNFESGAETGAAFAVYYKGDLVVDLWGGYVNRKGQIPWRENTLAATFSTSKGITALLVARFVELGYLDYKRPVYHYWPEFAQNGKEGITVEMLVSHQAGLIGFDEPISIRLLKSDYEQYTSLLAAQKPFWEPGSTFGYHMLTWGYYVDVLLMKADPKKRTLEQIFQEEITEPFGIDFFQGTPTSEHYRIASRIYMQSLLHQLYLFANKDFWKRMKHAFFDENGYQAAAKRACQEYLGNDAIEAATDYELRTIPLSSSNGYGTARAIAKLYGIVSNGGVYNKKTLLKESTIDQLEQVVVQGIDAVIGANMTIGRGVMILKSPKDSTMFGHPGFGGQIGICDRQNNLGIAYVTNNLAVLSLLGRSYSILNEAVFKCLEHIQDG